jgi:integration host factor subunit alpha
MTLTKTGIVKNVMEKIRFKRKHKGSQLFLFPELDCTFLNQKRATEIVDTLFEKIKESLAQGEDVNIFGFGKFHTRFKWARKGRNPHTGETIILRSRRVVIFKVSRKLRDKMNKN